MIDWTKPIETEDGLPARLISEDYRVGNSETVMLVQAEYHHKSVLRLFDPDGKPRHSYDGCIRNRKTKREGWVSVYSATSSSYPYCKTIFPSEDQAQKEGLKHPGYITTTKIEWEE